MEGFSITTERITSAGSGVTDVGTALAGEITTMHGLLSHGRSLMGAGRRYDETESAIAGGLPAVAP